MALATGAIVYTTPACPEHGLINPEMVPGVEGVEDVIVAANMLAALAPQLLFAVTLILPELTPKVTVIELVVCPAVMVAPDGTLQVYEVAPATAATEYVTPDCPEQRVVMPVIGLGVGGIGFTVTARLLGLPAPQLLLAITLILPEALPKVIATEVVPCPAFIAAPAGTLHV